MNTIYKKKKNICNKYNQNFKPKIVMSMATFLLLLTLSQAAVAQDVWSYTDSMNEFRGFFDAFTLTKLCDGRVLATGGTNTAGNNVASAEIYDATTGIWTPTGSMNIARTGHRTVLLSDCRVLVANGNNPSGTLNSTEIYNPVTGTWTTTGNTSIGRHRPTLALLNNGKVLIAAGFVGDSFGTASSELYNVSTGTWSPTGSLITCSGEQGARGRQADSVLSDGRVMIAGGMPQGVTFNNFASVELYNASAGVWSCTGPMNVGRRELTLSPLSNGNVLVTGGAISWTGKGTAQVEEYNITTGVWNIRSPMPETRYWNTATLLLDGTVLVAGGRDQPIDTPPGTYLNTSLFYYPSTDAWSPPENMNEIRVGPIATRLFNGRVLIVGGYNSTGNIITNTVELFGSYDDIIYNFELRIKALEEKVKKLEQFIKKVKL